LCMLDDPQGFPQTPSRAQACQLCARQPRTQRSIAPSSAHHPGQRHPGTGEPYAPENQPPTNLCDHLLRCFSHIPPGFPAVCFAPVSRGLTNYNPGSGECQGKIKSNFPNCPELHHLPPKPPVRCCPASPKPPIISRKSSFADL